MDSSDAIEARKADGKAGRKGGTGETMRFLIILFLLALALRSFIVAPFSIPSGSMLPKMMIGDYLFVAKWPYGFSRFSLPIALDGWKGRIPEGAPERGDVVVFRYPGGGGDDYVKRVIGLPGDQIQVRDGALWLNGEPVPRVRVADYRMRVSANSPCRMVVPEAARIERDGDGTLFCVYPQYRETMPGGRSHQILDQARGPGDDTPVYLVPEGHYFVMGDNRDDSEDSRFAREIGGVGFLPSDYLIGEALITFFSTDGSAEWLKPWTWFSAARWDRIGMTY